MLHLECEMAVGYSHGQWKPMPIEVEIDEEELGDDLEGNIAKAAENEAIRLLEDESVAFVTLLHWVALDVDE